MSLRQRMCLAVKKVITPNSEKFSIRFFNYLLPSDLVDGE